MFFIVYVSLADEQDMGRGGGPDVVVCCHEDQEEHSWLQDRGQSSSPKIYIDALRISALVAFSSILLLLVIEEKEEHEPLAC